MEPPERELAELAEVFDSGDIQAIRDRFDNPRRIRQRLTRYAPRVFLFPFDAPPDTNIPIQVFINGLMVWMGVEVELVKVGKVRPRLVIVTDRELHEDEIVQVTYTVLPVLSKG